jgi:predicted nucleic acid-binding protein
MAVGNLLKHVGTEPFAEFHHPFLMAGGYGFLKGNRQSFNERKLRQVISRLGIEMIGVDSEVARKYALIYRSLEKKGAKIPINDVWIGACCMNVGGTLLTRDKHFTLIDQIDTMIPGG